jgi:hypothetical protein
MAICFTRSRSKDARRWPLPHLPWRRASLMATVMRSSRMLVSAILAMVSLGCAAPVSAEQAPVLTVSVGPEESPKQESRAPQPQTTPEGTVSELYADDTFFHVRNALPSAMIQRFSRCFTPDLVRYFDSHNEDVERWLEEHKDQTLKLPMSEGPIFLSNYEGADTFSVGRAEVDGTQAQVPVAFSYTYGDDTFRWFDVAMLRLVDGVWLLDDIRFDPERWDDYTLRQRVALDE